MKASPRAASVDVDLRVLVDDFDLEARALDAEVLALGHVDAGERAERLGAVLRR